MTEPTSEAETPIAIFLLSCIPEFAGGSSNVVLSNEAILLVGDNALAVELGSASSAVMEVMRLSVL